MRHFPQLHISRKIWIVQRSKFCTVYIHDVQHSKFSFDHSETIGIKNIPLILLLFNMGKNNPSRIVLNYFMARTQEK